MSEAARDCLIFGLVVAGVALPGAGRFRQEAPLVRLAAGIGAGIILLYLAGGAIYLAGISWGWLWLAPLVGAADGWRQRSHLRGLLADREVRSALVGWLLLGSWGLGWHALVTSYSGGGWAGDWHEHFERAKFFALRWPLDFRFIGFNPLAARPPLANLVTGGLLGLAGPGLAAFQVFATLLSTLVIFPLAALAGKSSGGRPVLGGLTLLLMLNPLVVQNIAFPWTKLVAAYYVLLAVVFLPRPGGRAAGFGTALVALAAGMLAHYSTLPWIVALGAAWLWTWRHAAPDPALRREFSWGVPAAAALLGTWVVWGSLHYGAAAMVSAPSATSLAPGVSALGRVGIALGNIGHTLVPDWNSPVLAVFLQQPDWFSRVRDLFFCLYQQNLPVALGFGNLAVLGWLLARGGAKPVARPWLIAVPVVVAAGAIVTAGPVDLGVTHICLQPLVLLALAWLAVGTAELPRWLRWIWAAGLAVDFLLGIALHFGLQSLALPRWAHPGLDQTALINRFTSVAGMNFRGKLRLGEPFLGDRFAGERGLVVAGLAFLLGLALWQARGAGRKMAFPARPGPP